MKLYLLLVSMITLIIPAGCNMTGDNTSQVLKGTISSIVDKGNFKESHVTTRPHNRKVIYHASSSYWYVFYGNGRREPEGEPRICWKSSKDGIHWSKRHTAYEGNCFSSSVDVLLTGDKITMLIFRQFYYRKAAGIPAKIDEKFRHDRAYDFSMPYEISQFKIKNGELIPGPIYTIIRGTIQTGFAHYGSLAQDTRGFFWVGARINRVKEDKPRRALVVRSSRPGDISKWQPATDLFKASGNGTITTQVIALDEGKVFCIIFSQPDVKIYGTLYNPETEKWQTPYVIAQGNHNSKRVVASFDPGSKHLHLVYINDSDMLMYKMLSTPYGEKNWTPFAGSNVRGIEIASKVTTWPWTDNNISLSIDTSTVPAHLVVAYHHKTPHYRIRFYNGKNWAQKDIPIGDQKTNRIADEISMIRNFSEKLGLIYYLRPEKNSSNGEVHFIELPKDQIAHLSE